MRSKILFLVLLTTAVGGDHVTKMSFTSSENVTMELTFRLYNGDTVFVEKYDLANDSTVKIKFEMKEFFWAYNITFKIWDRCGNFQGDTKIHRFMEKGDMKINVPFINGEVAVNVWYECSPGFHGAKCRFDCRRNRTQVPKYFKCNDDGQLECIFGFYGKDCSKRINLFSEGTVCPCENDGKCFPSYLIDFVRKDPMDLICNCPSSFHGDFCEFHEPFDVDVIIYEGRQTQNPARKIPFWVPIGLLMLVLLIPVVLHYFGLRYSHPAVITMASMQTLETIVDEVSTVGNKSTSRTEQHAEEETAEFIA